MYKTHRKVPCKNICGRCGAKMKEDKYYNYYCPNAFVILQNGEKNEIKTEVKIEVKTGKEIHKFKPKNYQALLNYVNNTIPKIVENQEWCNKK